MMSCKTQIWVGLEGARPRTITLDQVQELRPHHIGRASASGWLGFRGLAGVRACVLALTLRVSYGLRASFTYLILFSDMNGPRCKQHVPRYRSLSSLESAIRCH